MLLCIFICPEVVVRFICATGDLAGIFIRVHGLLFRLGVWLWSAFP